VSHILCGHSLSSSHMRLKGTVHKMLEPGGWGAGEITCGYGDGGFTREQTMMVAYHRGRMGALVSGGLMAATGLSAEEAEVRKHDLDMQSGNGINDSGYQQELWAINM
jgi:hypothetical protein